MVDQNNEKETTNNEVEAQPKKIVTWLKDHSKTIRDIAIGAAAVTGIVLLTSLGKSDNDDFDRYAIEGEVESSHDEIQSSEPSTSEETQE